jgi:hypothetical protein
MTQESPAKNPIAADSSSEDLSAEIARTVEKGSREQVTCRRIGHNHYRCNWWAPEPTAAYDNPHMRGMMVTTSRISKSQFLRVTRSAGTLQITNLSTGIMARSLVD